MTIRPDDGTANGDTDSQPIAMVYDPKNGPLIAAAPDMLEALQDVAMLLEMHKHWKATMPEELLKPVRAAIIKAGGKV